MDWTDQFDLCLPDGLGKLIFNQAPRSPHAIRILAPVNQHIEIRFLVAGSYKAWPVGRDKRRTVKKLWQEYHVPTWLRSRTPLVFYGETLVAALGVWVEQGYQPAGDDATSATVTIDWIKD